MKSWLEVQGYRVRGEVGRCDLAAVKDDELIVVEMKLGPSLAFLAQAAERQEYADAVYVALPVSPARPSPPASREFRRLLRRLGIGLILIVFLKTKTRLEVAMHPRSGDLPPRRRGKRRDAILRELAGRDLDLTPGGLAGGSGRVSAYRQRAVQIAVILSERGQSSPAELKRLGARDDAGRILRQNIYGWFDRVSHGVYSLHPAGRQALEALPELSALYRRKLKAQISAMPPN